MRNSFVNIITNDENMKKYRGNHGTRIEELEVVKETEKQIVYIRKEDGREIREAKVSDWSSWHETKEDAVNYMIEQQQVEINELTKLIHSCNEKIKIIRSLL